MSSYLVDPLRFRFRKVVRVVALVILFVTKLKRKISHSSNECSNELMEDDLPVQFKFVNDKFLVTNDSSESPSCARKD